MTEFRNIDAIIATAAGNRGDHYANLFSIATILKDVQSGQQALTAVDPGVFAAYDSRYYAEETGYSSDAYTTALTPSLSGLALPTGYEITFVPTNANTGASTLDVGSTDSAVAVKKYSSGSKVDLAAGDLPAGIGVRLAFDGTHWVLREALRFIAEDTTIDVATSGGDYTTVGAAYASLSNCVIAAGVTVTISVAAGTFVESLISLDHPQGNQIQIVGAGSSSTTLSFSADADHGFRILSGHQIKLIDALTILSTTTTNFAINARGGSLVGLGADCVIDGWGRGIVCIASKVIGAATVKNAAAYNLIAMQGGLIVFEGGTTSGSSAVNIAAFYDGVVIANGCTNTGATTYGFFAADNGSIFVASVTTSGHGSGDYNLSLNTAASDGALIYT